MYLARPKLIFCNGGLPTPAGCGEPYAVAGNARDHRRKIARHAIRRDGEKL